MDKFVKYFILILIIGCANPIPPSGGPPDETPPEIIESYPNSVQANFDDDEIFLEFSEYVEKTSVVRNILIQPELDVEYKWNGKKLEIEFEEKPDSSKTYSVTLGTEYTDLNKNMPKKAFSIIFSSGSTIDSGEITGKLFSEKPQEFSIFIYNISDVMIDTFNIENVKPDYKIPLGTDGTFTAKALKDGKYRVIGVNDARQDGKYDKNTDAIYTATKDFIVHNSKSDIVILNTPKIIDEIPIYLNSAKSISRKILDVSLSEPIDTSAVIPENFVISDSSGNNKITPEYAYFSIRDENSITLILPENLDTLINYTVTILNDTENIISDTLGNQIVDSIRSAVFKPRPLVTEIIPKVKSYPFKDSTENISQDIPLDFIFNIAVKTDNSDMSFISLEDSSEIKIKKKKITDNHLRFYIDSLEDNKWYRLFINANQIIGFNDLPVADSIINLHFKTIDRRAYGGMSGIVEVKTTGCESPIIKIINQKENFTAQKYVNDDGSFEFDKIPSGKYSFQLICDENKNNKLDFGYPFPYKYSEKFFIPQFEVFIKSRWSVDDVKIIYTEER